MMASLRATIADLLRSDATLAGLLPGGVWERPLVAEPGVSEADGATPGAFDLSGQYAGRIKPSAVVTLFGPGQSFAGTSLVSQLGGHPPVRSRAGIITFYQPRPWRDAIEAATRRAEEVLDGQQVTTDDLGVAIISVTGTLGDNPGDDDLAAELDRVNLSVTTMRGRR